MSNITGHGGSNGLRDSALQTCNSVVERPWGWDVLLNAAIGNIAANHKLATDPEVLWTIRELEANHITTPSKQLRPKADTVHLSALQG